MRKGQKGIKIKFCKRGHEIAICGRRKNGECQGCYAEQRNGKKPGVVPSNICGKGHDKNITGKYSDNECMECVREHNKEYYRKNKKKERRRKKKWERKNKKKIRHYTKTYYDIHKDQIAKATKKWEERHPTYRLKQSRSKKIKIAAKRWKKTHKGIVQAIGIKSQTNRQLRVVAWTDWNKVIKVYKNKPKGKAVDHVIPLCGKKVAGLHVSWNLQYLTKLQNGKKGNRIDLIWASEWYGKILEKAGLK